MTITMVEELVPDGLWAIIAPLLPAPPCPWWGGRSRAIPDRNCFAAIVYMARTSTPWRLLRGCPYFSNLDEPSLSPPR